MESLALHTIRNNFNTSSCRVYTRYKLYPLVSTCIARRSLHLSCIGDKIVVTATCIHLCPDTSCSSGILVSTATCIWRKRGLRLNAVTVVPVGYIQTCHNMYIKCKMAMVILTIRCKALSPHTKTRTFLHTHYKV